MSLITRRIFQNIVCFIANFTCDACYMKFRVPLFSLIKKKKKIAASRKVDGEALYISILSRAFCIPRLRHKSSYALTSGSSLSQ